MSIAILIRRLNIGIIIDNFQVNGKCFNNNRSRIEHTTTTVEIQNAQILDGHVHIAQCKTRFIIILSLYKSHIYERAQT